jgi:putative flippase GtrA
MRRAFGALRAADGERTTVRRLATGPGGPPSGARGPRGLFRRRDGRLRRHERTAAAHRAGTAARHERTTAPAPARHPSGAPVAAPAAAPEGRGSGLGREASGFALVGAFGLAVDIGGYNALVHLGGDGWLGEQPLVAKAISLIAGTTVAYFGNRVWTYGDRPRAGFAREYTLYMALSGVALVIALACLGFSRYVLGLSSPMADNVAANGIGLALGSLFRFLSYRRYVFPEAAVPQAPSSPRPDDDAVPHVRA